MQPDPDLERYLADCRREATDLMTLLPASHYPRLEQRWAETFYARKRARQVSRPASPHWSPLP